jgi:hypothetical protein
MRHDIADAERLAARIRAYWRAKGFAPSVWVEQRLVTASAGDAERHVPVICSNLVNGWPPRPVQRLLALSGRQTTICPVCHWRETEGHLYGLPRVSGSNLGDRHD